jgi:hypothetical protein
LGGRRAAGLKARPDPPTIDPCAERHRVDVYHQQPQIAAPAILEKIADSCPRSSEVAHHHYIGRRLKRPIASEVLGPGALDGSEQRVVLSAMSAVPDRGEQDVRVTAAVLLPEQRPAPSSMRPGGATSSACPAGQVADERRDRRVAGPALQGDGSRRNRRHRAMGVLLR